MPKKKRFRRAPKGANQPFAAVAPSVGRAPDSAPRPNGWRERVLRATLVALAPALFLGSAELGLRLVGYGYETPYWLSTGDGKRYLSNPRFSWRFLGPELAREPIPAAVERSKPPNTYRVVVFGSSAAQGFPNPLFSFARILEAMWNDRYPETPIEVINTGITAVNSHAVRRIVRDSRTLAADLYLVYMGNNEVVGPFGPGTVFAGYRPSLRLIRAGLGLRATRVGQLLANLVPPWGQPGASQSWGGMEMFAAHRVAADDPRLDTTYANFRANLEDICHAAHEARTRIILATVVTNIENLPPFASVHKLGLTQQQRSDWDRAYAEGEALERSGQHSQAIERYHAAAAIDDGYADLHFKIGHCHLALQSIDRARRHFVLARDLDALRFRADSRINDIVREVAKTSGAVLVDAEEMVRGPTRTRLAGDDLLYEHVHLTFEGNYAIAAALFGEVQRLLPAAMRSALVLPPPSIERCAELTQFTALTRLSDTRQIRQVTARPPFTKETDEAVSARCRALESQITPEEGNRTFEAYRRRAEERPDDLLVGSVFAGMLRRTGQLDKAIQQYERVIERYPSSVLIRSELGQTLYASDRAGRALAEAHRVLELDPHNENAWTLLGLAYSKLGKADRAEEALRKAVAMHPRSGEARAALARALVTWGRSAEAVAYFLAALELDPEMAPYHFGLGTARLRQGDLIQALESFSRAAEIARDNASYHLQAAQTALLAKRLDRAREHFRRAVAIDPLAGQRDPELSRLLERATE